MVPDAVFVPSNLQRSSLHDTISTWVKLGAPVYLVRCIHEAELNLRLPNSVQILTIPRHFESRYLSLASSCNPSMLEGVHFSIPVKRTFVVQYSKSRALNSIIIVDDDIIPMAPVNGFFRSEVKADIVGGYPLSEPDVSIVDRIESQLTSISPRVSMSGSFLYLKPTKVAGFFPYIYNEDWIFILTNYLQGRKIFGCGAIKQYSLNDWKSVRQVSFEQFGDVIAYGLRHNADFINASNPWLDTSTWNQTLEDYIHRLGGLYSIATGIHSALLAASIRFLQAFLRCRNCPVSEQLH